MLNEPEFLDYLLVWRFVDTRRTVEAATESVVTAWEHHNQVSASSFHVFVETLFFSKITTEF